MHSFNNLSAFVPFGMFGLFAVGSIFLGLLAIALIALKGYSLWYAARRGEKGWFIALLLINTLGILELVYLYTVVGKWGKWKSRKSGDASPKAEESKAEPVTAEKI